MAQALDYTIWVEKLATNDIVSIYGRFALGQSLAADFHQRFGQDLGEDSLNQSHQIIIVVASLDSTERIVAYLSERGIPINVLFFQVLMTLNNCLAAHGCWTPCILKSSLPRRRSAQASRATVSSTRRWVRASHAPGLMPYSIVLSAAGATHSIAGLYIC